jgi:hypothetical protein
MLLMLLVSNTVLICSKLEYASVLWNKLTLPNSNKLQNMQKNIESLRYERVIQSSSPCEYSNC